MTTNTIHTSQIVLSLHDLNELFDTLRAEQLVYLDGQCVDWYGQVVHIVLLPNGLPALRVNLLCPQCEENTCTVYAAWNEYGAWTTLLEADGTFLADLCDADLRGQALICKECAYLRGLLLASLIAGGAA